MTPQTDPTRLVSSEDVPASLREALRQASNDGPSSFEAHAIAAGLGSVLGPGAGGASGPATVGGLLSAGKLAAIVGAMTLVAGGLVWSARTPSAPVVPHDTLEVVAPSVPVPEALSAPEEAPGAKSEAEESGPGATVVAPLPSHRRVVREEGKAAESSEGSEVGASKPSEAALLDAARRALSRDPARTLAYADQHRALYPRGMLAQEREVLVVEALRKLGRYDDAKKRDDEFRSRYPSSMHGRDLRVPGAGGNKN